MKYCKKCLFPEAKPELKFDENGICSACISAEQKEKIEPLGWIGIFFCVMAPLPVTGPGVGSISGYLLKLSIVKNFSATFMGTLTAIIVWFFCFDFLEQRFHMIQYLFAAIVIIVLIPYLKKIKKFITDNKDKKNN